MKDLMKIAKECMAELDALGIQYGTVRNWTVNKRAKCRWGLCKRIEPGVFDISISWRLLEDSTDGSGAKDTAMHELLHTCPGCYGHKGRWKELADKVNAAYPHYHIKRTSGSWEKGVKHLDYTPREYTVKYRFECVWCGATFERKKESKLVKHPEKFRCGNCGSRLRRIE